MQPFELSRTSQNRKSVKTYNSFFDENSLIEIPKNRVFFSCPNILFFLFSSYKNNNIKAPPLPPFSFFLSLKMLIIKLTCLLFTSVIAQQIENDVNPHYADLLNKSMLFYEAQRSGRLPESNQIPW